MSKVTVFLIVDNENLEAQACFLVPTLANFLLGDYEVIAFRRGDHQQPLADITREVLEKCNVSVRTIPGTNPGDPSPWLEPYPIGNKILAAADDRNGEIGAFFDSDTCLVAPLDIEQALGDAEIAAVVSDYSTMSNDEKGWSKFYGSFGLPLPEERVTLYRGRRLETPPYFNAGIIFFREHSGPERKHFGRQWLEDTRAFERNVSYPYDRKHLDQLSLPITAAQLGTRVHALGQEFNFNIQGHGPSPRKNKIIAHYHRFSFLWDTSRETSIVLQCLQKYAGPHALGKIVSRFQKPVKGLKRLANYTIA